MSTPETVPLGLPRPVVTPTTSRVSPADRRRAADRSAACRHARGGQGGEPPPARKRASGVRQLVRAAAWAAVLLVMVAIMATEGVGLGCRGTIPSLARCARRPRRCRRSRDSTRRSASWSVLAVGLHARVDGPLRTRLVSMADAVIADYRREEPTMAAAEWKQAQQALALGGGSRPADRATAGEAGDLRRARRSAFRRAVRVRSAARATYRRAVETFRSAAADRRQRLRSLPRDQPDRRLRSRRRRPGRVGRAGSREARLRLRAARAGAARRRLPAARDRRTEHRADAFRRAAPPAAREGACRLSGLHRRLRSDRRLRLCREEPGNVQGATGADRRRARRRDVAKVEGV